MLAVAEKIGVGHVAVTEETRELVGRVLDSGWFSPGLMCARFEREWAALHDRRYAVFVNSGTSALQIAFAAPKEKHGVETRRFLPLTAQPVYRELVDEDDFPNAKRVNAEGLYWGITSWNVRYGRAAHQRSHA